jgi:hypothetical protein
MVRMLRLGLLLLVPVLMVPLVQADDEKKPADPPKEAKKADGIDWTAIFKKLDTNSDGQLSLDEFKKLADLPEFKDKLAPAPTKGKGKGPFGKGGGLDLEKLKEKIGNVDLEKLKDLIQKRLNKDK